MSESKTWQGTQVFGLLRNAKSGRFYGRWKIGRKQKWVALQTDLLAVARRRFFEETVQIEKLHAARGRDAYSDCTVGELMDTYEAQSDERTDIRDSSKMARRIALLKIEKTWPELAGMKPSQVDAGRGRGVPFQGERHRLCSARRPSRPAREFGDERQSRD